jgi:hypothetical protein
MLLIMFAAQVGAQDKPLKKISFGVSTLSASLWIPWLAKEAKLFEKNGLDVDTVMRFVRSYVEGVAFLKQHKEFSQKVLGKYLRASEPEYLEGAYNVYRQDFIAAPYPITKNLEAIYEIVAARNSEIRNRKPEEFVDASFVAELEKSGFIKRLYEPR